MSVDRAKLFVAGLAFVALAGCGSSARTTPPGTSPPATATATAYSPTIAPSALPTARVFPFVHDDGSLETLASGTYVTGADGFFPGLRLTIPDGYWIATTNEPGQLRLNNARGEAPALLLWTDMAPTVTHNRDGEAGKPIDGVDWDSAAIVEWLTNLSDVKVLDGPDEVTVGSGITGTELTLTTSDTANFGWDDCPDNPHCVALLADPVHWGLNVSGVGEPGYGFFSIGGDEVARVFVGTIAFPDGEHTFYATVYAPDPSELAPFAAAVQPIIDSLIPPDTYVSDI